MAAYAQYNGCGYPTANQYLAAGGALSTLHPISQSPIAATTPAHPPASISPPSNGHDSNVSSAGGAAGAEHNNSGTLTPDPASQASNNGTPSGAGSSGSASGSTESGCLGAYGTAGALASIPPPPSLGATQHPLASSSAVCCDNGRPVMTDPMTGQTVCSCQYDPTRLALSSYARMQSAAAVAASAGAQPPTVGVYGTPYPSNEQNPYPSISVDSGPFYSSLSTPYALKDGSCSGSEVTTWTSTGLPPSTGYYTYDPTFGAYGYGASYDLASRRKNATRESTATLKAWLSEHKKNPYPTKGEKIMLAIITKMTLTQVSTWFANARRRLKKENKMTWEPKNRTDDDDEDALASDDEKQRHSEDNIGYAERRRHDTLDYTSGGAVRPTHANNVPTSAPASLTTAAVGGASSAGSVGATITAGATTSSTGAQHHAHVGAPGAGASVGAIGAVQPVKEALDLVHLNRVTSASPLAETQQPQSTTNNYQTYESPKYTTTTMMEPYISNGYNYVKEEFIYNPTARTRTSIWSLANTAADEKSPQQFGLSANNVDAMQREWPTSYMPATYAAPAALKQTSVVATISMQPTALALAPNQQRYIGQSTAVTPPQTPPNQLHNLTSTFTQNLGAMQQMNGASMTCNGIGGEDVRNVGCANTVGVGGGGAGEGRGGGCGLYCKGQDCA